MTQHYAIIDECHNEVYLPDGGAWSGRPGREGGAWPHCDGDCADCAPGDCGRWRDSALVCPACLEFAERAYPLPKFHESRLLEDDDGRLLCLECGETYRDAAELADRAVDALKDALDNLAWSEAQEDARQDAINEDEYSFDGILPTM